MVSLKGALLLQLWRLCEDDSVPVGRPAMADGGRAGPATRMARPPTVAAAASRRWEGGGGGGLGFVVVGVGYY